MIRLLTQDEKNLLTVDVTEENWLSSNLTVEGSFAKRVYVFFESFNPCVERREGGHVEHMEDQWEFEREEFIRHVQPWLLRNLPTLWELCPPRGFMGDVRCKGWFLWVCRSLGHHIEVLADVRIFPLVRLLVEERKRWKLEQDTLWKLDIFQQKTGEPLGHDCGSVVSLRPEAKGWPLGRGRHPELCKKKVLTRGDKDKIVQRERHKASRR